MTFRRLSITCSTMRSFSSSMSLTFHICATINSRYSRPLKRSGTRTWIESPVCCKTLSFGRKSRMNKLSKGKRKLGNSSRQQKRLKRPKTTYRRKCTPSMIPSALSRSNNKERSTIDRVRGPCQRLNRQMATSATKRLTNHASTEWTFGMMEVTTTPPQGVSALMTIVTLKMKI